MPSFAYRYPVAVAALLSLSALLIADAGAVVEQTDGSVVPVQVATCPASGNPAGCIQYGLNVGEGFAPTALNNPLTAVFDATTTPEVFAIPMTNGVFGNVVVADIIEGASFENAFGWYNVDAPGVLYQITPCTDEPGSSRTVNFQTEFVAGRYLGGFIGFFLITPENQAPAVNCGQIANVGHIYYTEQAKNGDGNYVHYLLYHSKVNPLVYYFGFEDLFRGGDNDFEDEFLKVTGLLAPCTPSAEVCDNLDNNCDGLVDNNPIDAGGMCGLTDVGECSFGTLECQGGALVCVGAVGPAAELCNLLDDNCNGVIDDNPVGQGGPCGTDVGECDFGVQQCVGGTFVCVGGNGPALEVCNLLDDDCDGVVDDAPIDAGGPCGSNVGVCEPGLLTCVNGVVDCVGGTTGGPEICNNLDDNCNGVIDDGDPGGGAPCGSDVGVCDPGTEHCVGGILTCVGGVGPTAEICDGLDNDCDGTSDTLAPCPSGSQCVAGQCAAPCQGGEFDCPGGQVCVEGYCVQDACSGVSCDPGETCIQGICVPTDGGAPTGTGTGGGGGSGGAGTGGMTSSSGAASGGSSGTSGVNHEDDIWGLATGGGGCNASGARGGGGRAALLLAIAAGLVERRRRRAQAGKQRSDSGREAT
jgi:hypothetical protein